MIDSLDNWAKQKPAIVEAVYGIIGRPPYERNTRALKIIQVQEATDYFRYHVSYTVADNELIYAYILKPKKGFDFPAVIAMHQYQNDNHGKDEPAGLSGDPELAIGLELVEKGYVVIIPDYLTVGERCVKDKLFDSRDFYAENKEWSIVGKNLEDSKAAVDVLMMLDYVNKDKIGVIGHSLGGHNAIMLFAFDERLKVCVSNCGFSILKKEEFIEEWVDEIYNFMPRLREFIDDRNMPFDFDEVISLACPKPWMNISSYYDDAYGNHQFLSEIGVEMYQLYKMHDAEDHFSYLLHGHNHCMPKYIREAAYGWMDRFLK